jgi:hypothetical protein
VRVLLLDKLLLSAHPYQPNWVLQCVALDKREVFRSDLMSIPPFYVPILQGLSGDDLYM